MVNISDIDYNTILKCVDLIFSVFLADGDIFVQLYFFLLMYH